MHIVEWIVLLLTTACCLIFQKTLPVMVAVVEQLGGVFGESGLLVLPCVAAHLNQVIRIRPFYQYFFFFSF